MTLTGVESRGGGPAEPSGLASGGQLRQQSEPLPLLIGAQPGLLLGVAGLTRSEQISSVCPPVCALLCETGFIKARMLSQVELGRPR